MNEPQKLKKLATEIVNRIYNDSSPENCTWGEKYPDAHSSLFTNYYEDLIESILEILKNQKQ